MSRRNQTPISSKRQDIHGWTTGIYLRLSREDGGFESCSIESQRSLLTKYIDGHEDLLFAQEYVDDGISGTSEEERPGYQQMMQDVKDGKIRCILVKDLSRAFRNNADQTRFLEETRVRYDVRFIATSLPFVDTHKHPETLNMLMLGFQGMMNENHSRETSIKVRDVFDVMKKNGKFIGSFAPYGYEKDPQDNNHLIIDEEAALVVRDIYAWFTEGMSKQGIAYKLNEMGIPNPTAYKRQKGFHYRNHSDKDQRGLWIPRTVDSILSNQMYLGHMVQGKQTVRSYKVHERVTVPSDEWIIVEDTHEAIIDRESFDLAQNLMRRDTRTAPNSGKLYLFSGFVRCGDCNKAMRRKAYKKHVYLKCRTYTELHYCKNHSIREDVLQDVVLEAVRAQINLVDSLAGVIEEINKAPRVNKRSNRLTALLNQHKEQLVRKKDYARDLYRDMKDGLITKGEYLDYKQGCQAEIAGLERAIAKIQDECAEIQQGVTAEHPYFLHFQKYRTMQELDRKILGELIHTIYVHHDRRVEIVFALADQHRRILEFIENNKELTSVAGRTA